MALGGGRSHPQPALRVAETTPMALKGESATHKGQTHQTQEFLFFFFFSSSSSSFWTLGVADPPPRAMEVASATLAIGGGLGQKIKNKKLLLFLIILVFIYF
jgi:hypothetical protein